MNFQDNPQEAAFRAEVREFIDKDLPANAKENDDLERGLYRGAFERLRETRQKLASRGWIAPAWPK